MFSVDDRLPGRRALLLAAGAMAFGLLHAQEAAVQVEGQRFVSRLQLADTELVLNGTGVRAVAWFKGYVAALYLPRRSSVPDQVLAMPGPKRVQLRLLQDVPAEELVKALQKGLSRNSGEPGRLAARAEQLARTMLAVGTVKKGDRIDLDQDPTRGTLFALNGTLRGEPIAGADFYAALLASFVGQRPYDKRLKAGLLGLSAP